MTPIPPDIHPCGVCVIYVFILRGVKKIWQCDLAGLDPRIWWYRRYMADVHKKRQSPYSSPGIGLLFGLGCLVLGAWSWLGCLGEKEKPAF